VAYAGVTIQVDYVTIEGRPESVSMTEMYTGETVIKVMPAKVDEMLRKGWQFKAAVIEPTSLLSSRKKLLKTIPRRNRNGST
jgi:hypothetical protein